MIGLTLLIALIAAGVALNEAKAQSDDFPFYCRSAGTDGSYIQLFLDPGLPMLKMSGLNVDELDGFHATLEDGRFVYERAGKDEVSWGGKSSGHLTSSVQFVFNKTTLALNETWVVNLGGAPKTIRISYNCRSGTQSDQAVVVGKPQSKALSFVASGPMKSARDNHTATLLSNGEVLVAGGDTQAEQVSLSSAELYDAGSATWKQTGTLISPRDHHAATLLANGTVLVAGGARQIEGKDTPDYLSSAEIYSPVTRKWSATGSMGNPRYAPAAVLLPSGKVLLTGGYDGAQVLASAEIYDPATATWTLTESMMVPRFHHRATLLANGSVLVTGGLSKGNEVLSSSELFDPATGKWALTGPMVARRVWHTATLLSNGTVLVAGGTGGDNSKSCEFYDPMTRSWVKTGSLNVGRMQSAAVLLDTGQVLTVGGTSNNSTGLSSAEIYDPKTKIWTSVGDMKDRRFSATATLLRSGQVLVAGGFTLNGSINGGELSTTELFSLRPVE